MASFMVRHVSRQLYSGVLAHYGAGILIPASPRKVGNVVREE